jgi:hypothetical protein
MEIEPDRFACSWCARPFRRRFLVGRKPVYCAQTCRQRAYEARRRGALVRSHPRPTPVPPRRAPPAYEAGRRLTLVHALRPDGFPTRYNARPTLCGAWAQPIRPPFGYPPGRGRNCRTCQRVAHQHPPERAIDPSRDLAIVTTLIGRLRTRDHQPPPLDAITDVVAYCWPGG